MDKSKYLASYNDVIKKRMLIKKLRVLKQLYAVPVSPDLDNYQTPFKQIANEKSLSNQKITANRSAPEVR